MPAMAQALSTMQARPATKRTWRGFLQRWNSLARLLTVPMLVAATAPTIDRHALVERHAVTLTTIDPHAPVMLGNSAITLTADITGLRTLPERYAPQAPLLTMAQWAWHSVPNPHRYPDADGELSVTVPGRGPQPFAY